MLKWVLERVAGTGEATETAIGHVPTARGTRHRAVSTSTQRPWPQLLSVDNDAWRQEVDLINGHFEFIGESLPKAMRDELADLEKRLAG